MDDVRWLVLVVRVPAEPSRHRVAVWRELRRVGAVSLGQGAWIVPDAPVFADGVARARAGGKPVIVSMGDVAASGGYLAAVRADVIVADLSCLRVTSTDDGVVLTTIA